MPVLSFNQPTENKIFKTHLNYIQCMRRLTNGLQINVHVKTQSRLDTERIHKFERLNSVTRDNIQAEINACDKERAYSQIAAPWIPVKCYYRLYYLESILCFLVNESKVGFGHGGHTGVRKNLQKLLKMGQISVSQNCSVLSNVDSCANALLFRAVPGANLRPDYHGLEDCEKSLRKKLANYIEADWKHKKNISNYKSNKAQDKRNTLYLPSEFGLLDFYYWMRIKANYRDVDFLDYDNDISEDDAYAYLSHYLAAYEQYAQALESSILQLKGKRRMLI